MTKQNTFLLKPRIAHQTSHKTFNLQFVLPARCECGRRCVCGERGGMEIVGVVNQWLVQLVFWNEWLKGEKKLAQAPDWVLLTNIMFEQQYLFA